MRALAYHSPQAVVLSCCRSGLKVCESTTLLWWQPVIVIPVFSSPTSHLLQWSVSWTEPRAQTLSCSQALLLGTQWPRTELNTAWQLHRRGPVRLVQQIQPCQEALQESFQAVVSKMLGPSLGSWGKWPISLAFSITRERGSWERFRAGVWLNAQREAFLPSLSSGWTVNSVSRLGEQS